jgi:hypothetical protein
MSAPVLATPGTAVDVVSGVYDILGDGPPGPGGGSGLSTLTPAFVYDDGTLVLAGNIFEVTIWDSNALTLAFGPETVTVDGVDYTVQGKLQFQADPCSFSSTIDGGRAGSWKVTGSQTVNFSAASLDDQITAIDLLDTGDSFTLSTVDGGYLYVDPHTSHVMTNGTQQTATQFSATDSAGNGVTVSAGTAQVTLDASGTLIARAGLNPTTFYPAATLHGTAVFGTAPEEGPGEYLSLQSDGSVKAVQISDLSPGVEFTVDISMSDQAYGALCTKLNMGSTTSNDPCTLAKVAFVWQLTGGLFLTVGLNTYFAGSTTAMARVWNLLQNNPVVKAAIDTAWTQVASSDTSTNVAQASWNVLDAIWDQRLLKNVIWAVVQEAGWRVLFALLGKIAQIVALPEAAGPVLLASTAIWIQETFKCASNAVSCCGSSAPAALTQKGDQA